MHWRIQLTAAVAFGALAAISPANAQVVSSPPTPTLGWSFDVTPYV